MKKLIAISIVLALISTAAFAVDLGGTVIGQVSLFEGDSADGTDVMADGGMKRVRLEGAGGNEDGSFGGWLRWNREFDDYGFSGIAWWKPIDMLKVSIGGNPDGIFGKEGVTGWMFYQTASDSGVVNPDNVWSGDGIYHQGVVSRNAFFGGFGSEGLMVEIRPIDVFAINIAIPFVSDGPDIAKEMYKKITIQADINLDFGNIAITYTDAKYLSFGKPWEHGGAGGVIYGYFGLTAIENLGLDVGFSFQLPNEDETSNPIAAGVGVKFDVNESFGFKVRAIARFGGEDGEPFCLFADVLPYFKVSDTLRVFFSAGLGMVVPDEGDSVVGWHINPYIEVGSDWGPNFYAGIRIMSDGIENIAGDKIITWAVPIGIGVSF